MIDKIERKNKTQDNNNINLSNIKESEILATAMEQASVGILMTDTMGNIIYANHSFEKMSGYRTKELIGRNPRIFKSGSTPPETYKKMWKNISSGKAWNGEQINRRKDGSLYYEDSRITPIYDKDNNLMYYLAVKHDITDRKELEAKLQEVVTRDPLTNAYNRRFLMERLNQISDNYKRVKKAFSVGILDIDTFKSVNDQYGHQAGDYILVELVKEMDKKIRSYDILSRYGGEEFLLVLPDTEKGEAYKIVERISEVIRNRIFVYENNNIKITFSAGIADANEMFVNDFNINDLIKLADSRLYEAKNAGRNQIIK